MIGRFQANYRAAVVVSTNPLKDEPEVVSLIHIEIKERLTRGKYSISIKAGAPGIRHKSADCEEHSILYSSSYEDESVTYTFFEISDVKHSPNGSVSFTNDYFSIILY